MHCSTRLRRAAPRSRPSSPATTTILLLAAATMAIGPHLDAQATARADSTLTRHLMPVPASVTFEPGRLVIDSSFTASTGEDITGVRWPQPVT